LLTAPCPLAARSR